MMSVQPAHHSDAWYVRAFGELYPLIYAHRDDAAARREIGELARVMGFGAGDRVLDIACGAGRHLAALAEMGCRAVGVDLSESLLEEAAERRTAAGRLVRADVRELPFGAWFDAAVNLFTSFGYFESDEENAGALRGMAGVLRRGGRLAVDVVNPAMLRRRFVPHTRDEQEGVVIEQWRTLSGGRVSKRVVIRLPDGEVHEVGESVRVYEPGEMLAMASAAGLSGARLVGDFDGRVFGEDSQRMILLAERN